MTDLRIKKIEPHEYEIWNSFVDSSQQGDVFCYSWWLDAITNSRFDILAVFDKNEIVAGIPLAFDETGRINEPPLTRTLGILYKTQDHLSSHKKVSDQRRWLDLILENIRFDEFVQMCMHHNFNDWLPFRWKGYKQTTRYTYLVYYKDKTVENLWRNLNQGRKNSITRALKNNIRVEESDDFSLLYDFACLSYKRQGLKFRTSLERLQKLDCAIKKNGRRLILKVCDDSDLVHAVAYFAYNKRSAYYLLSGGDERYRTMGGHTLIVWEALKYFMDKVEYFNFGGSDIKHIEEHVRGFGGILTPYFHIFNENLMWKRTDSRYHLKEIFFHAGEIFKNLRRRFN